jgi:hypothetical protein
MNPPHRTLNFLRFRLSYTGALWKKCVSPLFYAVYGGLQARNPQKQRFLEF